MVALSLSLTMMTVASVIAAASSGITLGGGGRHHDVPVSPNINILTPAVIPGQDMKNSTTSSTAAATATSAAGTVVAPSDTTPTDTDTSAAAATTTGLFTYPPKSIQESDWIRRRRRRRNTNNDTDTDNDNSSHQAATTTTTDLISTKPTIDDLQQWSFDPLVYEDEALDSVFPDILQHYNFQSQYNIPLDVLSSFSVQVRKRHRDVVYHNWSHIISVLHMTFMFLEEGGASMFLLERDIFALLLSAFIHDIEHPGHNNDYENHINSTCSQKYETSSVLENHSLDITFNRILSSSETNNWNILQNLEDPESMKKQVAEIVLRTDVSRYHGRVFTKLQQLVGTTAAMIEPELDDDDSTTAKTATTIVSSYFEKENPEHRMILCQAVIKAADIANPTLQDGRVVRDWALRISTEFKNQVNKERNHHVEYLPFMDIETEYDVAKGQLGFYTYLVLPYFEIIGTLLPKTQFLLDHTRRNLQYYQKYVDYVDAITNTLTKTKLQEQQQPERQHDETTQR